MLNPKERKIIEAVRKARGISISIDNGSEQFSIRIRSANSDIRKVSHDKAIALQDYFNTNGGFV